MTRRGEGTNSWVEQESHHVAQELQAVGGGGLVGEEGRAGCAENVCLAIRTVAELRHD